MPAARTTDPRTSHEAAESVRRITATKFVILDLLTRAACDEDLVERYNFRTHHGAPKASPSGIRSRRKELVDAGLVEQYGLDWTASGRSAIVWGLTVAGRDALDVRIRASEND